MSSRAVEIALFLIIVQASIGFVNATGLFTQQYYATPQNQYSGYTVQNLSDYNKVTQAPSSLDYLYMAASWAWFSFWVALNMVFSVITIFPALVLTFHVPTILATFIQAGVYFTYVMWYAQWRSGKGMKLYD